MFMENMSLIEGIGDEVTNFFIILITFVVVYIAWRSTNVRENRTHRAGALLIIDYNRRIRDRVAQHPLTMSILRSSSRQSNSSNVTEELEIDEQISSQVDELTATISEPPNLLTVLDEINSLNTGNTIETVDSGPEQIIQEMDRDTTDGLRRRHINYNRSGDSQAHIDEPIVSELSFNETEATNSDNCANENNENSNLNRISSSDTTASQTERKVIEEQKIETLAASTTPLENEIRIKLKYLNDELKLVSGMPSEPVGEFKKRNFSGELAGQKSVRLVFNGHVLQPDTKTLQSCGLFDNCVVHCLIHNKKPSQQQQPEANTNRSTPNNLSDGNDNVNFNLPQSPHQTNRDRAENGPLLIYLGMCFISLVLVCGWYCRFRYNFLFSWYSTTGLVLMTVLFLVMIPLNVLLERESSG